MEEKHYEVVIIGGGISGSALLYELAKFSNIKSLAIVEKYEGIGTLNTKASANSQTIHCGDIETNYTLEKAKSVKAKADMINKYIINHNYGEKFAFKTQKLAMGVGEKEVEIIKNRFEEFKTLYPYLELFDKSRLKEIEPRLIFKENGEEREEDVVAMGTTGEVFTTVDFGAMAVSLIENAKKVENKICDVYLNTEVEIIDKIGDRFYLKTKNKKSISADFVVVNAGAHSLYLAHKMGVGKDIGSLSMAGSFFLTKEKLLNGKVYMVQNPKLPFAALHADPDILANGCTRFGPTALPLPKLERYHGCLQSSCEWAKTLNLSKEIVSIFYDLLKDGEIRNYLFRNIAFEIPGLGVKLFVKDARKIIPSLKESEIYFARGFGGVRPQVLNKKSKKLEFGEFSVNEIDGIIFNMTPSPGATSCLGNAYRDAKIVCDYLGKNFDENKFKNELVDE